MLFNISSCTKRPPVKLPPVKEGWHQIKSLKLDYKVQKNDSLYSIAWAFGLDHRKLAAANNLQPPYNLKEGQRLKMGGVSQGDASKKISVSSSSISVTKDIKPLKNWIWPTKGVVKNSFSNKAGGNKGVDIGGEYGQAVIASQTGKIVYSGAGIRSYGNLIIIKHNDDYLSAYGYNSAVLVQEGEFVKTGQKIAELGRDSAGNSRLHFEIRRLGKPVNPIFYLSNK